MNTTKEIKLVQRPDGWWIVSVMTEEWITPLFGPYPTRNQALPRFNESAHPEPAMEQDHRKELAP